MSGQKAVCAAIAAATIVLAAAPIAGACTRVLWNDNKLAVVAGRTMDWPESTEPIITVLPRRMRCDGGHRQVQSGESTVLRLAVDRPRDCKAAFTRVTSFAQSENASPAPSGSI
jgi:Linear amide C-N hydrolases, choloylglycine hydrolase family